MVEVVKKKSDKKCDGKDGGKDGDGGGKNGDGGKWRELASL